MFGKRKDGTLVRGLDPIGKAIPYFMPHRYDALNMMQETIDVSEMDAYIKREAKEKGIHFTYMHVVMAALVRIYALRPMVNRFVINSRLYQRKDITISITVKKSLTDEGEEGVVKLHFKGNESIYEVKDIIDKAIAENLKTPDANGAEKAVRILGAMPGFLYKFAVGMFRVLDRWGMLPASLIEFSPFHTGLYFTNLKSIKNDAIFHHIYDFGTCSVFMSMGKEKMMPVVVDNERLEIGKRMNLGITMDERICDGFYFAKSLRIFKKILSDPTVLNEGLDLPALRTKKEEKVAKKQEKKQTKRMAKQKKIENKQIEKQTKEELKKKEAAATTRELPPDDLK